MQNVDLQVLKPPLTDGVDIYKNEDSQEPRLVSKVSSASIPTIQHDTSNSSDLEIKEENLDITNIDARLIIQAKQAKLASPGNKKANIMIGDTRQEEKAKKIASMYRSRRTKTYDDDKSGQDSDENLQSSRGPGSLMDSMRGKNSLMNSGVMTYVDTAGAE